MTKMNTRSLWSGRILKAVPFLFGAAALFIADNASAQIFTRQYYFNARPVTFAQPAAQNAPAQAVPCSACENQGKAAVQADNNAPAAAAAKSVSAADEAVLPEMKTFPGSNSQWEKGFSKDWIAEEKERHEIKPQADNKAVIAADGTQKEGDTYGNYTEKDLLLWQAETERPVVLGSLIFHDAGLLGSKNGVSCDMCHPDGEGTHAETYPKYQVQLGRAALLRDMANWCLENPCMGEPMSGDDFRMRALEAYMQAQRYGKPMKYGKH